MGRIATGSNFEYGKSIKLTKAQNDNWDSKKVKAFLDGDNHLKFLYELMENKFEKIKDFTPEELETLLKIEEVLKK